MSVVLNKLKIKRSPFRNYRAYISQLHRLMKATDQGTDWDEQVLAALNGQASVELRRIVAAQVRRKFGVYFTGTTLGDRLCAKHTPFDGNRIFYDPTCGMGDLLLAVAKMFSLSGTLHETLTQWGQQLSGTDLHAEFVEGTKTRLVLLARQRLQTVEALAVSPNKLFPYIRVGNALIEEAAFRRATTLLMNPPFGPMVAPSSCKWARGRVTSAAIFMETALERVRPGTEILAILPEVLRAGSFSERWRNRISSQAEIHLIEPCGIFDSHADVDVFLLRLIRRPDDDSARKTQWSSKRRVQNGTVSGSFNVHVGRVVPHRDADAGPEYAYIHPRCVPPWTVMRKFSETRHHEGQAYHPPFVVIRRTSRPGDTYRATATIIAGAVPIAVENHLIVCEPKDGSFATCKALLRQLKTEASNTFLNRRICCRHLTVGSVGAIPFE